MSLMYVALMHKANKKSAPYGVTFPDFPGCVFAGRTIDEAMRNAREGLIFHMEGLLMAGETLAKPTSLEKISADKKNKKAVPCLIQVVLPTGRLKRINVSLDAGLLVEIDRTAKMQGKNRSEFLAGAAQQMLA